MALIYHGCEFVGERGLWRFIVGVGGWGSRRVGSSGAVGGEGCALTVLLCEVGGHGGVALHALAN